MDRSKIRGVLNLDKPGGLTSRDVVDKVSRPLRGIKVGHAGTLDPLASGVLIVCVGAATRLIEYVQRMPKTYRAVVLLGARSDTLDADGRIVAVADPPIPTVADILPILASQVGSIAQLPPQFSALKVGGVRAYDLARAGQEAALTSRVVEVHRIDLLSYAWPRLELEVECGSGTYIRSIARDVGEALGCGGLIEELVRTRIGPFSQADALDPLALDPREIPNLLRPASEALATLPQLAITAEQLTRILRGQSLPAPGPGLGPGRGEVALIGPSGDVAAIAELDHDGATLHPRRVLATDSP